jgi:citrate lyase gamma subunit
MVEQAIQGMIKQAMEEHLGPALDKRISVAIDSALEERLGPAINSALEERLGPAIDSALDKRLGPAINSALVPVMKELGQLKIIVNQYVERKRRMRIMQMTQHSPLRDALNIMPTSPPHDAQDGKLEIFPK